MADQDTRILEPVKGLRADCLLVIQEDGEIFFPLESQYFLGANFGTCREDRGRNGPRAGICCGWGSEVGHLNLVYRDIGDFDVLRLELPGEAGTVESRTKHSRFVGVHVEGNFFLANSCLDRGLYHGCPGAASSEDDRRNVFDGKAGLFQRVLNRLRELALELLARLLVLLPGDLVLEVDVPGQAFDLRRRFGVRAQDGLDALRLFPELRHAAFVLAHISAGLGVESADKDIAQAPVKFDAARVTVVSHTRYRDGCPRCARLRVVGSCERGDGGTDA